MVMVEVYRLTEEVYRLVETGHDGRCASETFTAPSDAVALSRVLDVSAAPLLELWRHGKLVARIDRRHLVARAAVHVLEPPR
jgi:hypothetical protein